MFFRSKKHYTHCFLFGCNCEKVIKNIDIFQFSPYHGICIKSFSMVKTIATKFGLLFVFALLSSFSFYYTSNSEKPFFTCVINDKPFVQENVSAILRKITGGETQLSITNDRFVKFSFLNPKVMDKIDLSNPGRKVYIRYEDPASLMMGQPVNGYVNITSINQKDKLVSGEFEFDMEINNNGTIRTVKIKQGKFENLPIEIR